MSKFTAGPWTARPQIPGTAPALVVRVYQDEQGRRCTQFLAECNSALADNTANANLIAAAPTGYELISRAVADRIDDQWLEEARAYLEAVNA